MAWPSWLSGKDWMDPDHDNANSNYVDPDNGDGRSPQSTLCASFDRIREFVLSHALSFHNNGREVNGSGMTRNAVCPVLHAHPHLNPMGASKTRRRGQKGGRRTAAVTTAMAIRCRSLS